MGDQASVGGLLREWRRRRRLSQLDLALEAEISTRHLSFLETGRALPSRDMVLHLADRLDVPLRERNALLVAAGYAPLYRERPLSDPGLKAARDTIDLLLSAHAPFPAIAIDRKWHLVSANAPAHFLMSGIAEFLLRPPVNVLRLSLHPDGLAPRILNLADWRSHLFHRLARQIDVSADAGLIALLRELRDYPMTPSAGSRAAKPEATDIAVPLRLRHGDTVLNLLSTTTVFGTPIEVTLSELALESFFPADAVTASALRSL